MSTFKRGGLLYRFGEFFVDTVLLPFSKNGLLKFLALVGVAFLGMASSGSALTFIDTTATDFNLGDYNQTQSTADGNVILSRVNDSNYYPTGDFNSQIFDAAADANWQRFVYNARGYYGEQLPNSDAIEIDVNMTGNSLLLHLNESAGATTAADNSGSGNNGSCTNCPTFGATGKFGNGAFFDGSNDTVTLGTQIRHADTNNYSVSLWYKGLDANANGDWGRVLLGRDSGDIYANLILRNGYVEFLHYNNAWLHNLASTTYVADNVWHHIVYVNFSNETGRMYVDGKLQATGSSSISDNAYPFRIDGLMRGYNGTYSLGTLDDIAVWDRSISDDEILNMYRRGALRLKLQLRTCNDSACSGETFVGPSGTNATFFDDSNSVSDLNTTVSPDNRYFQYRAVFETDDVNYLKETTPALLDVNVQYGVSTGSVYSVKTFLNYKPRSFFAPNQTILIRADGNSSSAPNITIRDANGIMRVDSAATASVSDGDTGTFDYNYTLNGATGWYSVQLGSKLYNNVFYQGRVWSDKYTDADQNVYPFSFDLNVIEPNIVPRWVYPIDKYVDFNRFTDFNSVRVLDYNGQSYLQIPAEIHDTNTSGSNIVGAFITFLASMDKNETRTFTISYSTVRHDNNITSDLNILKSDFNFSFQNSAYLAMVDLNLGGLLSRFHNRLGSDANLTGYIPMQLSPESKAGPITYTPTLQTAPHYSIDVNGKMYSRLRVWSTVGGMDYNLTYHFYANSPFFLLDMNTLARTTESWSYLYDDYIFSSGSLFTSFGYSASNSPVLSTVGVDSSGSGVSSMGDVNYYGVFNTTSGNGIGSIFVNRSSNRTFSIATDFVDGSSYEYWIRRLYTGSVSSGDYFNSRIARLAINPFDDANALDDYYLQLKNPPTFSVSGTSVSDLTNPDILDTNRTPFDSNDMVDLNCFVSAGDNLQISSVDINIQGPDLNVRTSQTFTDDNVTANYIVTAGLLNAGSHDCNFRVFDVAGNSSTSTIRFGVKDFNAPGLINLGHTPDNNFSIDPGKTIRFDVNFQEYSGVSDSNIYIRWYYDTNSSWSDWNSIAMSRVDNTPDYNYEYDLNYTIPSDLNLQFEYKSYLKDVNGYDRNTAANTFFAYTDNNWTRVPGSFGSASAGLDTNAILGDLNVVNNTDATRTFTITTDWEPTIKVFVNGTAVGGGYSFNVAADSNVSLPVLATAKTTERSDSITLTITPSASILRPTSITSTGTVVSNAGGAFLLTEITVFETSVTQSDTNKAFTARITNQGDYDGNNVTLAWTLPSGWSVNNGTASVSAPNLTLLETLSNPITVNIASSATTGTQTLIATATCCSDSNKTRTTSVNVTVNASSGSGSTTTTTTTTTTTGGSSGGGSAGSSSSSGGGGGSIFRSEEEAEAFFKASESEFELLRGRDSKFVVLMKNPFEDKNLLDLKVSVGGLLSRYLSVSPESLGNILVGEEKEIHVSIEAPTYFTKGEHTLFFTISGTLDGEDKSKPWIRPKYISQPFEEKRTIKLIVREVDKQMAQTAITSTEKIIEEMESKQWHTTKLKRKLGEIQRLFAQKKYEELNLIALEINETALQANAAMEKITQLNAQVLEFYENGIDTQKTTRLLLLADLAFERGDYSTAVERLSDAENVLLLETKGAVNITAFVIKNRVPVSLAGIIIITLMGAIFLIAKYAYLTKQIDLTGKEEKLLLNLIKEAQHDCFVKAKMSLGDYYDTLSHYEKKVSETVERNIRLETQRLNMFKFKSTILKLQEERAALLEKIKSTQEDYFKLGTMDARIFGSKMKSLLKRFSEVEKDVVLNEVKKSSRTKNNPLSTVWKAYYYVFK